MLELSVQTSKETVKLQFEHSLRSLSKWESITRKPFLGSAEKSPDQMLLYFQCMLLTPDVDPDLIYALNPSQTDRLTDYINENQTASWVSDDSSKVRNDEVLTSELIYFTMTSMRIDWQAQDWHLSRLMMLIRITSHKNQPPKKRKPSEVYSEWRAENERRKKMLGTSG